MTMNPGKLWNISKYKSIYMHIIYDIWYIYIHVIDCYIVIANNSIILKTLKWSYAFILKNTAATILRKYYTTHAKNVWFLAARGFYTLGLHSLPFRRMHGFDAVLEGHRPWAHFPRVYYLVFGHPVFVSILVEDVVNTFGLFVCLALVWLFAVSLAASWPAGLCISLPPWLLDALLAWLKAWWHYNIFCLCTQLAHWYVI